MAMAMTMAMVMTMALALPWAMAMAVTHRIERCRKPRMLPGWLTERVCGWLRALKNQTVQDLKIAKEEAATCRDTVNDIGPLAHGPMTLESQVTELCQDMAETEHMLQASIANVAKSLPCLF